MGHGAFVARMASRLMPDAAMAVIRCDPTGRRALLRLSPGLRCAGPGLFSLHPFGMQERLFILCRNAPGFKAPRTTA